MIIKLLTNWLYDGINKIMSFINDYHTRQARPRQGRWPAAGNRRLSMEASGWQADRKARLINWLLWWRVDPAEFRAALAAAVTGSVAYHAMPYELSLIANAGVTLSCLVLAAFALGWLALGGLLLRGHRAAIPGLMSLCTAQTLSVGIMLLTAASS